MTRHLNSILKTIFYAVFIFTSVIKVSSVSADQNVQLGAISNVSTALVDQGAYAGLVTLVAKQGEIVHLQANGSMGLSDKRPVKTDTLFRIYSMTKPITATAAMILVEEGKLDLDAPVHRYLPSLAGLKLYADDKLISPSNEITVHNLLTHTAGMVYGWTLDNPVDVAYAEARLLESDSTDEFIDKLAKLPLRFEPGSRYFYSVSMDVVGAVIEAVSGQRLGEFMQERIFTPLGMRDTFFEVPDSKLDRLASDMGWSAEHKAMYEVPADKSRDFANVSFDFGGGGLVSTAMDYFKFSQMILNGGEYAGHRVLKEETVKLMTSNHLSDEVRQAGVGEYPVLDLYTGQSLAYGFGVVTNGDIMPHKSPTGSLSWGGVAGTKFWIDPKNEIIAIALVQQYESPWQLRQKLADAVYGD